MIVLSVITAYILIANLSISFRLQLIKNSFSRVVYQSILMTIFQIFVTVSLLGFVQYGISYWILLISNFLISSIVFFINRKFLIEFKNFIFKRFFSIYKKLNRLSFYFSLLLLIGFIFEIVFISSKIYFFPNYVWDEMVYHLHPVVVWFQENQIIFNIPSPNYWVNGESLGSKRIVYWLFVFLGKDSLVNGTQLFGGILLFLSSYRFLSILGMNAFYALSGSIAVFNLPLILIQTQTNQEHLNLASFTLTTLVLLVEKKENRFYSFLLILISMVLMLSTKTSAFLHFLLLLPFIVWAKRYDISYFYKQNKYLFIPIMFLTPIFFIIILIQFNIMSLIVSSIGLNTISLDISEVASSLLLKHINLLVLNLNDLPKKIMDMGFPYYNADSDSISSYGPFFISFGLFGLVFFIYELIFKFKVVGKHLLIVIGYTTLLQLVYFSFYRSPWNFRLFILFSVVAIVIGFYYLSKIRAGETFVFMITSIIAGFCFIATSISDYSSPKRMNQFVFHLNQNDRTTMNYYQNMRQEHWIYINQYLDENEPIAYFASRDAWIYPYFNTNWKRRIHYLPFEVIDGKLIVNEKLLADIKGKGVNFLHIRKENMEAWNIENIKLEKIADGIYFIL